MFVRMGLFFLHIEKQNCQTDLLKLMNIGYLQGQCKKES